MTDSKPTTDGLEILYNRYYKGNPERIAELEEARVNDDVARKIRELREEAGLSQRSNSHFGDRKASPRYC